MTVVLEPYWKPLDVKEWKTRLSFGERLTSVVFSIKAFPPSGCGACWWDGECGKRLSASLPTEDMTQDVETTCFLFPFFWSFQKKLAYLSVEPAACPVPRSSLIRSLPAACSEALLERGGEGMPPGPTVGGSARGAGRGHWHHVCRDWFS